MSNFIFKRVTYFFRKKSFDKLHNISIFVSLEIINASNLLDITEIDAKIDNISAVTNNNSVSNDEISTFKQNKEITNEATQREKIKYEMIVQN